MKVKACETGQNRSKLVKTGQNWSKLVKTGQNWSKLVKTGQNWSKLVKTGHCEQSVPQVTGVTAVTPSGVARASNQQLIPQ